MATNYPELYKTYANYQLLDILQNAAKHPHDAVMAAERELDSRNLSLDELKEARQQLDAMPREITFGEMAGFQNVVSTDKNIINMEGPLRTPLLGLLVLAALYSLLSMVGLIRYILTGVDYGLEVRYMVLAVVNMLIIPVATVLFANKNKLGWIAMQAVLINICINAISSFYLTRHFFPFSAVSSIVSAAIFLFLMKDDVRNEFGADRNSVFISVGIAVVLWGLHYALTM